MKNALKDYIPNCLNAAPLKYRDESALKKDLKIVIEYIDVNLTNFRYLHEKIYEIWEMEKIIVHGESIINKNSPNFSEIINFKSVVDKLLSLSYWFSKLEN